MTRSTVLLALLLVACGEAVTPFDATLDEVLPDSSRIDAGVTPDAAPEDSGTADARPPVEPGECRPYRDGTGLVSHVDCAPYLATPVCDVITRRCVPAPADVCDACETDAQCADAQPGTSCVFLMGVESEGRIVNGDSACLWPCSESCAWLAVRWGRDVTCREGWCLPAIAEPNCRDPLGMGRLP